jgi:glycogen debranching enzyme
MKLGLQIKKPRLRTKHSEKTALDLLRVKNTYLYQAAYPGYPGNFSRDSFIYAMLAGDKKALRAQVEFSAGYQGEKYDPSTGEEPGKIHHEMPGVSIGGKFSTYNACDTTALFLIAIASLYTNGLTAGDKMILKKYSEFIDSAIDYIKSHVRDGLFYEDPSICGAKDFGLKVTYWKDSEMNHDNRAPAYPIVYSLAHFQNAAAIEAIGKALKRRDLIEFAHHMTDSGLSYLWSEDHFIVALDGNNHRIDPPSSDSLHSLLYINPDSIPDGYGRQIERYMRRLATNAGYLTGIEWKSGIDDYHTRYVWTHEQALLHEAARRHGLSDSSSITRRITGYISTFPELVDPLAGYCPAGNQPQLWAVGASLYFKRPRRNLL